MNSPAARRAIRAFGLLLLILPRSSAFAAAGEWRAAPWTGWEWTAMKGVEDELAVIAGQSRDEWIAGLDAHGESADAVITRDRIRGGIGYGVEIGRMIAARTGFGARAGAVEAKGEGARAAGTGEGGESYQDNWSFDHSLTVVMVGLWQEGGRPDGFSWRGSVFVGPAWADSSYKQTGFFSDPLSNTSYGWDGKGRLTGSTLAIELGGQASLSFGAGWAIFAEAAYMFASVNEMQWRSDVDVDADGTPDYRQGTILLSNKSGQPLPFDFSGLRLRAGIAVRFGGPAAAPDAPSPDAPAPDGAASDGGAWGD